MSPNEAATKYLAIIEAIECRAKGAITDRLDASLPQERRRELLLRRAAKRDKLIAEAAAHRSYLPFVEAGLMTVAQCVAEVGQGRIASSIVTSGDAQAEATRGAGKDVRLGLEDIADATREAGGAIASACRG